MSDRYATLFSSLRQKGEGAFVPFIMLGDPTADAALAIVRAVVDAGADALELGVPFSDPVADGPTIQASHIRALDGGATVADALAQVHAIRSEYPDLPIGMLIYGNVAFTRGIDKFYADFAAVGADSILLPDVPAREGAPFIAAAEKAGIDPIFIAPAQASAHTLEGVARSSRGYIYAISRDGVTGTEKQSETAGLDEVVARIDQYGGAPVLLGFGISSPTHVAEALSAGASGAITGSAITKIIERHVSRDLDSNGRPISGAPGRIDDPAALHEELTAFVSAMKAATRSGRA